MSAVGLTGVAAYFGLLEVGRPVAGETVVVSGAAGATGSVVGQIAKIKGCRAIGIAGRAEKCHWLTDEAGFGAAIDYKSEDVHRDRAISTRPPDAICRFDQGFHRRGPVLLISLGGRVAALRPGE